MTNREAIYKVKKLFREVNADSRLSNKFAFSLLETATKWLIPRESDKQRLVRNDRIFQKVKCVKVIEAPLIDPCCGIKSKCTIYRTEDKLPPLYEDDSGVIIRNVTTIDGQVSLFKIKPSEWERKQSNPWIDKEKKNKFFFFSDGYLYFPNGSWKMVEVDALFNRDISDLDLCDDKGTCGDETKQCKPFLDRMFIFPDYLEAQMYDAVKKDLFEIYEKLQEKSNQINKNDNK